jgi:hypothetical protein
MKLLLEDPANVRDLLNLQDPSLAARIDFSAMRLVPTSFIGRDFRNVESDILLTAPLLRQGTAREAVVWLYLLLEHQSEPDPWMELRLLDYVVQVFKAQQRQLGRGKHAMSTPVLDPVVPVVFYTGTRSWDGIEPLPKLIRQGAEFADVTPRLRPLFLNLSVVPADQIERDGGFFGWVLRLVQRCQAPLQEFRALLQEVVEQLEQMPVDERFRWLELLSYIHALVYHGREEAERRNLQQVIEASVQTDPQRPEVTAMGQTIAEGLRHQGAVEALQKALLRLLRKRFRRVPSAISTKIKQTTDRDQLDTWLIAFATATALDDIGIA